MNRSMRSSVVKWAYRVTWTVAAITLFSVVMYEKRQAYLGMQDRFGVPLAEALESYPGNRHQSKEVAR